MISLHRLEGFYWVAKTQGYSRAARAFPYPITQAGVHHQVRKLEDELGVKLFERVGRDQMRLTPAGKPLFEYAAHCFEQLPEVVAAVRSHRYGGDLRIHSSRQLLAHVLPSWLRRLKERRADVPPQRNHETDLVVEHLAAVPDDVATLRVATIIGRIVVPADQPTAFRIRQLRRMPFVAYPAGTPEHAIQLDALRGAELSPSVVASAPDAESLIALVGAGLGYSLVPMVAGAEQSSVGAAERVRLVAPSKGRFEYPVYAAWRNSNVPNPLVDEALAVAPTPRG